MGGETQPRVSPHLVFALAGLESGVLGAGVMLLWLFATSLLIRTSMWAFPNLLAAMLYRASVLRSGFSIQSIAGIALLILMAGLIGVVFGSLVGAHPNRLRVALLAVLAALLWYYASQRFFWNRLGVIARIHVPPVWSMTGYLAFGLVLARYPRRLAALERHFAPAEEPPPAPVEEPGTPRNPMVE